MRKRPDLSERNRFWSGEKSPRWKKLSVKNVHNRIARKFGKASKRKCVDCGKKAREWSNEDGKRYSLNFKRYKPRCASCHRKKDYTKRQKILSSKRMKGNKIQRKNWTDKQRINHIKIMNGNKNYSTKRDKFGRFKSA